LRSSARKAAVKDRIIYLNPAVDVELPKVIKPKVQPPDKKDLIAIRQRATPEMKTLILIDGLTDLRRGEVLPCSGVVSTGSIARSWSNARSRRLKRPMAFTSIRGL
jgi:hypothetical protein